MDSFARKEVEYDGDCIEFQALEWNDCNQPKTFEDDMLIDEMDECEIPEEYVIRSFGVTREGHSVCLSITGFTPFFYVKIPEAWGKNNVNLFLNNLCSVTGHFNGRAYSPLKKWAQYLLREKCLIQRKKDFYGFSGGKEFKFLRLTFNNSVAMKKFVYAINSHNDASNKSSVSGVNFKIKLYESNLDSILKFMHIREIKPTGWVSARNIKIIEGLAKVSRCQIEASVKWTDTSCDVENETNARVLQASFDIEVYSIDGSFPIPGIKENCVTQIATAFKYFGDTSFYVKHIITLKDCAEIVSKDDVPIVVESYATEKEVLLAWKHLVNTMDPDILYTYNGDQFDCNYLNERAKITKCSEEFLDLSKLKETNALLQEKHFSSSAYGTSNYRRLSIPGRINFDLLIYIQREYKENSYKLDNIAEKYLGQKKNDMTPQQMFDFFASGDPEKIAVLGRYCFSEGTPITTNNMSICIENLFNSKNTEVLSWDSENKTLGISNQNKCFNNGQRDCVEIILEDGSSITCTEDHKLYTDKGWVKVKDLDIKKDTLYKSITYPSHDVYKNIEKYKGWSFKEMNIDNYENYMRTMAYVRILGYLLTDGYLGEERGELHIGNIVDAENILKDIQLVSGIRQKISKNLNTFQIHLPRDLSKSFFEIKGIPSGNRTNSIKTLPYFIKDSLCPKPIIQEFLGAFFGGDGSTINYSKNANKFSTVSVGQSSSDTYLESNIKYMEDIQGLLSRFEIDSLIHSPVEKKTTKYNKCFSVVICIKTSSLKNFQDKIGFRYCLHKQFKFLAGMSYYNKRQEIVNQQEKHYSIFEKIKDENPRFSYSRCHQKAADILKKQEIIINDKYSFCSTGNVGKRYLTKGKPISRPAMKNEYFGVKSYLEKIGAYKYFDNGKNFEKSYGMTKESIDIPYFKLSIREIKKCGIRQVYDIQVDNTHSYLANGIISHNCIQDTLLPQLLVDKLHILQNQISMSNVTYVPVKYLIERGQSIKAFSQILRETRKAGYLVPVLEKSTEEAESFEGATVLAPDTGAYFSPVTVCDFASLYPSIIRAHNLCFSTIVLDENYADLPDTEYNVINWEEEEGSVKHSFKYCSSTEGILPKLLKELTESRKKYKKLMKEAQDPFSKEIYNKCQLAVKVSMNSIYGFLAAPMLTCKGIAATVTAYGRKMIVDTKKFMEEEYPCSVAVYGDSVTGSTPLLLEKDGEIHIETIQSIFDENNRVDYPGFKILDDSNRQEKEYSGSKFRIWTDKGWQNIKKVIRHKCDKKIYNVLTHTGYVEVTEDHSLLDENAVIIKPKDCIIGTKLLSSYPGKFNESCSSISKDRAFIYGFFYGDGSCGFYECNSGNKYSWALNNADLGVLDNLKTLLHNEYPSSTPIVYDTLASSGVYKLTVNNQKGMVNEFRDKFYDSEKNKKVPTEILNSSNEIIQSFFDGYWAADGCRKDKESIGCERFDNKGQIGSAGMYYLMKKLGYKVSLNTRKDKENMMRLTLTKKNQRKVPNEIKKLESREHHDFVYDIETDSGRFQAGVGDIIVKNTDSVFVKFKTQSTELFNREYDRIYSHVVVTDNDKQYLKKLKSKCIEESMVLGREAADAATKKLFKIPISLEYEKVYCPLLLLSKKRYIGELYSENPEKMDYLDNKGVVLKRRDNFELLRICYQKIVDIFVEDGEKGLDKALAYIRTVIDDIKNGTVDKDLLVVTKTLKGPYKSLNIPHVVLSKILAERDPGNAPRSNDRIPYIFIDNGWTKATTPQYLKVEDPQYAKHYGLPVDTEYYIKYLMNPICEILELFMENPEEMFKKITMEYRKQRLARIKKAKLV